MAKREIKSQKGAKIPSPAAPRSEEQQLEDFIKYMIEEMQERYKNQVFNQMHKSTIKKFATSDELPEQLRQMFTDQQTGNFANVFLRLAKKVRRKLVKQFPDDRLEEMAKKITEKVNRRNQNVFYNAAKRRVGVDKTELEATEGLTYQINAYQLETAQWIKKIRDETLQNWTANTLRDMAEGRGIDDIMSQFDSMVEQRKNHAQMVARTQISTFNSLVTKTRARNLGIEKAIWVTSEDERVRNCHAERHGREFELAEGLYSSCDGKTLLPGVDYNCFPGSVQIDHSSLCQKFYRRWYAGELAETIRDDGIVLHATPNHPILTVNGFKPAGRLDIGDNIICTSDERINGIKLYAKDMIPTFEQIFSAFDFLGVEHGVAPAGSGKFHGDTSNSDIDVISMDSLLVDKINPALREKFAELDLSSADMIAVLSFFTGNSSLADFGKGMSPTPASIVRSLDLFRSGFLVHLTPLELFGFALGTWSNPEIEESLANNMPSNAEVFSDCVFALAVLVHGLDVIDRKIDFFRSALALGDLNTKVLKVLGEDGRTNPDLFSCGPNGGAVKYKVCSVVDNRSFNFSGHVYNLQSVSGDYITNTTAVSNCRCTYQMVIPPANEEAA